MIGNRICVRTLDLNADFTYIRNELDQIQCPTLIIAGDDDKTVGNEAYVELHERINKSELYVYDGLGHGAYEEAKDFYERVFMFCR